MADLIRIGNDKLSAAINPLGAELSHLRDPDGRELMTDADPAYWTGRAPILFPVVGRVTGDVLRIDGVEHPMPKHGFARRSTFEVVAAEATRAAFALTDTAETRAAYPFTFRLEVAFRLDSPTLLTEVTIENRGERPMPAQFGFHPAFAWPLPYGRDRAAHRILFDRDETGDLRAITPDGFIAAESRPTPLGGRELRLYDALFANDALVWDPVRSQALRYGAPDGPQLDIAFPDTPGLGIWTKPGARYVCVEPWHGIADPAGYAGEFRDKPGVFEIAPGDAKQISMSVTLVP
ncbi:aldose 1-epimerase family protein [uncultured Sphingomonas sp.]|uniref:aldose 1-epimerase family protein n=1 Tax=uncultured Sphingomonas sp. TaxID=158754 RepID=UPI0035CA1EAF